MWFYILLRNLFLDFNFILDKFFKKWCSNVIGLREIFDNIYIYIYRERERERDKRVAEPSILNNWVLYLGLFAANKSPKPSCRRCLLIVLIGSFWSYWRPIFNTNFHVYVLVTISKMPKKFKQAFSTVTAHREEDLQEKKEVRGFVRGWSTRPL
jgi:hypothetical protein